MQKYILFVILLGLSTCFKATAQDNLLQKDIVLHHTEYAVKDLLEEIGIETGLSFSYSETLFNLYERIILPQKHLQLFQVLDICFGGKGIEYIAKGSSIILRKYKPAKAFLWLQGRVQDSVSGNLIPGVVIKFPQQNKLISTGMDGTFQCGLPSGEYELEVSILGYETGYFRVVLYDDKELVFQLKEKSITMDEIVIEDRKEGKSFENLDIGRAVINNDFVKRLPAFFGENDMLKALQLLPGVQSAGDGIGGLYIRGGSADHSLILLDDAVIYNPDHLLGIFSVFNPDAIQETELYKGGIPPQYGGRLASIVLNRVKEGDFQQHHFSGGIGILSSRLTANGPLVKNKASYLFSGRRSYLDVLIKPFERDLANTAFYFYDFNGNITIQPTQKDKVFVGIYNGADVFKQSRLFNIAWGNSLGLIKWERKVNDYLFLTATTNYSRFKYGFLFGYEKDADFKLYSKIGSLNNKFDFDYFISPENKLNFGVQSTSYTFSPTILKISEKLEPYNADIALDRKTGIEKALYISNEKKISSKILIDYGLRYSAFINYGSQKVFLYEDQVNRSLSNITDTLNFRTGELIKLRHGLEPRIKMRYLTSDNSSLKFSYNRMQQYIQVASSALATLPMDRWIPSDYHIKPQIGDQVNFGFFKSFNKQRYDFSVEAYYKYMQNQIDYKDFTDVAVNFSVMQDDGLLLNNHVETQLLEGIGWSYGIEMLLKKNYGKITGWAGYTLSRTRRRVEGINGGLPYSPRHDRTHDLTLVLSSEISKKLILSGTWVYATGNAVTLPEGKYVFEGIEYPYYTPDSRNAERLPDYHRLDLSLIWEPARKPRKWKGSWNLGAYNIYMRKNPVGIFYSIYAEESFSLPVEENPNQLKGIKFYFTIIPSISYNFKF